MSADESTPRDFRMLPRKRYARPTETPRGHDDVQPTDDYWPQSPARTTHERGEPHRYRIECEVCGQRGIIRLTVDPERLDGGLGLEDAAAYVVKSAIPDREGGESVGEDAMDALRAALLGKTDS